MSSLQDHLNQLWNTQNFPHALHIYSEDVEYAFKELQDFVKQLYKKYITVPLENNTDFMVISNKDSDSKFITIDQVRALKSFFNKSLSIAPFKMSVIYKADLMNNNAFNSCLKLLEEPPLNSYIFLVTIASAQLPATIVSRCHKFYLNKQTNALESEGYSQLIKFLNNPTSSLMESLVTKITSKKDNQIWQESSENLLKLYNRLYKIKTGISVASKEEHVLESIANQQTIEYIIHCYEGTKDVLDKTYAQDLDRRHSMLLVFDKLRLLVNKSHRVGG
jgi:DNA polymerase-3 subunit delta'